MSSYLTLLKSESASVVAVELRPPRAELEAAEGMDAWIDTYHAIRSLTRHFDNLIRHAVVRRS